MSWSREHERCVDCGTDERKHYARGFCVRCYFRQPHKVERANERRRELYQEDPEKVLSYNRSRRYGLSEAEFLTLLVLQNCQCKICEAEFGEDQRPHVDHDHACCSGITSCGECVRGLLCRGCNHGLGQFQDDPVLLRSAAAYLE